MNFKVKVRLRLVFSVQRLNRTKPLSFVQVQEERTTDVQLSETHLQSVDHSLHVRLHGLVGKFGAGQRAHALQRQVTEVGFSVLEELAQLVTGSYQQGGLAGRQRGTSVRLRYRHPNTVSVTSEDDRSYACQERGPGPGTPSLHCSTSVQQLLAQPSDIISCLCCLFVFNLILSR